MFKIIILSQIGADRYQKQIFKILLLSPPPLGELWGGGSKNPKSWLRNTWMFPYWLMSSFLFSLDLIWSWISLLWHWFGWSWFKRHLWWPQGLYSRLQCLSPRHPNPHYIGTIKTQQSSKDFLRSTFYVRAHHMFSRIL